MHDLAHTNYYQLKQNFGVLGTQLYAHSWGIDRSFLGQKYKVKSKSIGNSKVLNRDRPFRLKWATAYAKDGVTRFLTSALARNRNAI